jgi:crossover junction endodeoxyribonuclease RuvC
MSGALAWTTKTGDLIEVADMPIIAVRGKNKISGAGLMALMTKRQVDIVVIEAVSAMPRHRADGKEVAMGASSSINFGYGAGLIEGVATGLGLPVEIVAPATWKRRAQVPADKGAARQMAQRLWPGAAQQFARVKDHGRSDSALLARWFAIGRDL